MSDGVWASVTGTVGRVFTTKNGPAMVVDVSRPQSQYPDHVTVWDAFTFAAGDRVSVEGWLSWRKREYEGRTYVDVSLNAPRLSERSQAPRGRDNSGSGYVETQPDSWGTQDDTGSVPF